MSTLYNPYHFDRSINIVPSNRPLFTVSGRLSLFLNLKSGTILLRSQKNKLIRDHLMIQNDFIKNSVGQITRVFPGISSFLNLLYIF